MMTDLTPAEKLVDETLAAQRKKGREKYGRGLDAHDGHDWLMEALQELADATQYLAAENVRLKALLTTTGDALATMRSCPFVCACDRCIRDADAALEAIDAAAEVPDAR